MIFKGGISMDERVRTILNGEDLIANRDNWFHQMSELFLASGKSPCIWLVWALMLPTRI